MANGNQNLSEEERLIEQQFARSSAGNPQGWAGQPPVTADSTNQGNGGFLGLAGHPLSWILALAPHNPDLAAHLMALLGKAPPGPKGTDQTPRTQEDTGPSVQGTQITPRPRLATGYQTGVTGDPSGAFGSSIGIAGADGQAQARAIPPPIATAPAPAATRADETTGASSKDTTAPGGTDTVPMGVSHPSAASTMSPLPGSPTTDPSGTADQMKKIGDALQSAFGSIKMPEDKWTPMPQPQLPQTTHRFSPADLLSLVGQLSTPAQKQASSLGALIGGQR